jgi:hypothetical protein
MTDEYEYTRNLDLLGDWLDAKGYTEEAGLITRSMDFMHAQARRIAGYQKDADEYLIRVDELNALRERIAALEAALKKIEETYDWPLLSKYELACIARAALGEK